MSERTRSIFADSRRQIERVREGTAENFVGPWVLIGSNTTDPVNTKRGFSHSLGRVPVSVDVLRSEVSDGGSPSEAVPGTDVTVEKDARQVTVQNDTGRSIYFQVRAR